MGVPERADSLTKAMSGWKKHISGEITAVSNYQIKKYEAGNIERGN